MNVTDSVDIHRATWFDDDKSLVEIICVLENITQPLENSHPKALFNKRQLCT